MAEQAKVDWDTFGQTLDAWFDEELQWIERHWTKFPRCDDAVYYAAEYLLEYSKQFVATAVDAYRLGRFHAGLTCCRTVYEVGVRLASRLSVKTEATEQLDRWWKGTLREQKALCQQLADHNPNEGDFWSETVDKIRAQMDRLPGSDKLRSMPEEISRIGCAYGKSRMLYAGYRDLCDSAHPGLHVWRIYDQQGAAAIKKPFPDESPSAVRLTASAAFLLVSAIHIFYDRDRTELDAQYQELVANMDPSSSQEG